MNLYQRPLAVIIIAVVYIAVGAVGFIYHFPNLRSNGGLHSEDIWIELSELLALLAGLFLLRHANWARFLAVAWISFHVGLSVFDAMHGLVVHIVFALLIAWFLFRPSAKPYFQSRIG